MDEKFVHTRPTHPTNNIYLSSAEVKVFYGAGDENYFKNKLLCVLQGVRGVK